MKLKLSSSLLLKTVGLLAISMAMSLAQVSLIDFPSSSFTSNANLSSQGWYLSNSFTPTFKVSANGASITGNSTTNPFLTALYQTPASLRVGDSLTFSMDYSFTGADLTRFQYSPSIFFTTSSTGATTLTSTFISRSTTGGNSSLFAGSSSTSFSPLVINDNGTNTSFDKLRTSGSLTLNSIGNWTLTSTLTDLTDNVVVATRSTSFSASGSNDGSNPIYFGIGSGAYSGSLTISSVSLVSSVPEPSAVLGIGLVFGLIVFMRREDLKKWAFRS